MTAMFGTMDVHVAAIEWPSDWGADVDLLATHSKQELDKLIRTRIEDMLDLVAEGGDAGMDDVIGYVRGEGRLVEDFDVWYDTIHDLNTSPWVTRGIRPVEIV